ncbi:MAG TPA: N-acetylmuramoyl-L-alanine amidase [Actinomycetota bacterium]|jgi:N-acetylmuramoyl-L-alanine amidase|nr:N-acetylmuramoyl-L-alanine amidase [Actinomycetota bacterium]
MSLSNPRGLDWLLLTAAIFVCAAGALTLNARLAVSETVKQSIARVKPALPSEPKRGRPATIGFDLGKVGAVTTRHTTPLFQAPDPGSAVLRRLRLNVLLPIDGVSGSFLRVMTPCEAVGWVRASDVFLHPRASGPPGGLRQAVLVLDPGHGGMQAGAVGPNGLAEKDANLAIAYRLAGYLKGARLFLTRTGDFTAGLRYRTAIANSLNAHALISIHNNSAPDGPSSRPGSETWHQSGSPPAQRLSNSIWTSLVDGLRHFKIKWVGDKKAGTRTRLNERGHDFYGLLRGSTVPTVLVEAMYISNGPEEALLRRADGQDAVAKAVAKGLRSYVSKAKADVSKPYPGAVGTAGGVPAGCVDPA